MICSSFLDDLFQFLGRFAAWDLFNAPEGSLAACHFFDLRKSLWRKRPHYDGPGAQEELIPFQIGSGNTPEANDPTVVLSYTITFLSIYVTINNNIMYNIYIYIYPNIAITCYKPHISHPLWISHAISMGLSAGLAATAPTPMRNSPSAWRSTSSRWQKMGKKPDTAWGTMGKL